MKKFLVALLFSAVCAFASDLTGSWRGSLEATRPDGSTFTDTAQFKLKQDGTTLTGSGGGPNDNVEIHNGKVEGESVSFELHREGGGVMKLALKVDGDTMTGDVRRERNGRSQTAKLTLKREK